MGGSTGDFFASMAGNLRLALAVALAVTGAVMFRLSVTFLSPCGLCSPGPWWVEFLRTSGAGVLGTGIGAFIGASRGRGPR